MKFTIAILLIAAIAAGSSVEANPVGTVEGRFFWGFPSSSFFLDIFLQSDIQRILATYTLSDDLRDELLAVLTTAQTSIDACNVSAYPWVQKPCIKQALTKAKSDLAVLQAEIAAYVATTTATTII